MSEFRESLLTRVIHLYGFESPYTLEFAELLSEPDLSDVCLEALVSAHEAYPMTRYDEWCEEV